MFQHPDSEPEEGDTVVPVDDAKVTFTDMIEALSKNMMMMMMMMITLFPDVHHIIKVWLQLSLTYEISIFPIMKL